MTPRAQRLFHGAASPSGRRRHDERAEFLACLATMLGCWEEVGGELPDGRRPDVLRVDSRRNVLFVGDAKHTEGPSCSATLGRLQEYLRWASVHVRRRDGIAVFAVCFGRSQDETGWVHAGTALGREVGIEFEDHGVECFGLDLFVAWFVARPPAVAGREHRVCRSRAERDTMLWRRP